MGWSARKPGEAGRTLLRSRCRAWPRDWLTRYHRRLLIPVADTAAIAESMGLGSMRGVEYDALAAMGLSLGDCRVEERPAAAAANPSSLGIAGESAGDGQAAGAEPRRPVMVAVEVAAPLPGDVASMKLQVGADAHQR